MRTRPLYLEIFLVAFGVVLLEISYTRVFSFKLFYYFTYLIVGIALLGMGSGGVIAAISPRFRRLGLERVIPAACMLAGLSVGIGYFAIALIQLNSLGLPGDMREDAKLVAIAISLFVPFLLAGIVIASVFAEDSGRIHRLYFADLVGAGIACALVVPLIRALTPPACVFASGLVFVAAGLRLASRHLRGSLALGIPVAIALSAGVARPTLLPQPIPDELKTMSPQRSGHDQYYFSSWSPVFRVDVMESRDPDVRFINHDGLIGSMLLRFDGDLARLGARFDHSSRSFPFAVVDRDPEVLIIGAAGGHEVLASLYYGAAHVTGVELNPVTYSLLTTHFADYTGNIAEHERVTLVNGEGRSFLEREERRYDIIFFVAPDSYAAMNSATSGAFVLSESYLYTTETIRESLAHLTPDGVLCMSFGEIDFEHKPNRTSRYLSSARVAFEQAGIPDFAKHVILVTQPGMFQESMMLIKRSPFSAAQIEAFREHSKTVEKSVVRYAWTQPPSGHPTATIISASDAELRRLYAEAPYEIGPVSDDAPFFWHFARFRDAVLGTGQTRVGIDMEDATGERVLMTLLATVAVFAAAFLLLPFVAIRELWSEIPYKTPAAIYFSALGLGFMFFEIVLIQKLTLFLGYPTYSLTVTLGALLLFTGVGSLLSAGYSHRRNRALLGLFVMLSALMLFYQFGIGQIVERCIGAPLAVRIAVSVACLAPLGLCLGAFMPLGLGTVANVTAHGAEFVAWGWAINGFFSVISSILATMLSMTFGFTVVLALAVLIYGVGILALLRIPATSGEPMVPGT
jgi:hypothetical protein